MQRAEAEPGIRPLQVPSCYLSTGGKCLGILKLFHFKLTLYDFRIRGSILLGRQKAPCSSYTSNSVRDTETIIFGTIFRENNPQVLKIWGINRLSDSWAHPAYILGLCSKTICLQVEHVPHFHPSQHNSCFYHTWVPWGDQQANKSSFYGGLQNCTLCLFLSFYMFFPLSVKKKAYPTFKMY